MKYIELLEPKIVRSEPKYGLWFRHQSPYKLASLSPVSYNGLKKIIPEYDIDARIETEQRYRTMYSNYKVGMSFLYATIVSMNSMEDPLNYPGFTYLFQLSKNQIADCLFDVTDKRVWMEPEKGALGLVRATDIWNSHNTEFLSYSDSKIGVIYPRIEVIIPFVVIPNLIIPQEEDR